MNDLFLGFYFGVICTVLIYNIQWYINSKEKSYLYYVLMHLSLIFIFLHAYNVFTTSLLFSIACAVVFSILFCKEFLNIKKYYPKFDKILSYFIPIYLFFIAILYVFNLGDIIAHIPQSVFYIPFLILGFFIYKKGNPFALYFIIGWGLFSLSVLVNYLVTHLIGPNEINRVMVQAGNITEAIILSFALSQKTKILMQEKMQQEKMLIHQSRLASMGEMLANISHQWRQPLNRIASFIMNMQLHIMDNYKKEEYLLNKLDESQMQLEYMSQTIDDFSNFYKKEKHKEHFPISNAISNAQKIIDSSLKATHIELTINIINDYEINSYPKELAQVILNLLQNAKDALVINKIETPKINVTLNKTLLTVEDNAGGIQENILDYIFDPYFTTKEKHKGTGLGLYMSKVILEKNIHATIKAKNNDQGAVFTIYFS